MRAALLAAVLLGCATAEPEPTPERPPVVCGVKRCDADREFLEAMAANLSACLEANESLQRPAIEVQGIPVIAVPWNPDEVRR